MGLINKPFPDFVELTTAESAKVNAVINLLYTTLNGDLDDANVKALANIQQSKILNLAQDLNTIRTINNRVDGLHFYELTLSTTLTTASPTLVSTGNLFQSFTSGNAGVSGGRRFLVNVIADVDNDTAGAIDVFALYIDGAVKVQRNNMITTPGAFGGVNAAFSFVTGVLLAGQHTAEMYFATSAGLMYLRAGAIMQVVEFPGYTT